jgi:adenylate cyclase
MRIGLPPAVGWVWSATSVLVEALLNRRAAGDLRQAEAAVDRLAAAPTDIGFVLQELPQLRRRALLARSHGDAAAYQQFMVDFRAKATEAGFDPLVAEQVHGTFVE